MQLATYKHNAAARNCLCLAGPDYLVAAQGGKDALHFWTWHKVRWGVARGGRLRAGVGCVCAPATHHHAIGWRRILRPPARFMPKQPDIPCHIIIPRIWHASRLLYNQATLVTEMGRHHRSTAFLLLRVVCGSVQCVTSHMGDLGAGSMVI
jgi:hypothetical protein